MASKSIPHTFLLALNEETEDATREGVIKALEGQGAKILNVINYKSIMQAISFEDTNAKAAGQSSYQTAEAQIEAWKSSLSSFGESIVSIEQDQIVTTQAGSDELKA